GTAVDQRPFDPFARSFSGRSPPSGVVNVAVTSAPGTGLNAASRASTSIGTESPGSDASGTTMATGSGEGRASHRAACRQKNSWVRSIEADIIFHRHDASPANTIERPWP